MLTDVGRKALSTISLADLIDPPFGTLSDVGSTLQILAHGGAPGRTPTE